MNRTVGEIMEARRARLHAWIKAHHEGSQAAFVHATGINRGELSSLLHAKPFGESRAATLEELADMPKGYLVFPLNESGQTSAAVPPAIQRFAGFGPELQDLLFTLGEAAQALPEIAAHLGTLKQLVHKRLRGGPASPKPKKPKKRKSGS